MRSVGRHIDMTTAHERTAIARAEFFLALAEQCRPEERTEFEAFLEAAIVFARAALHRLKNEFETHPSRIVRVRSLIITFRQCSAGKTAILQSCIQPNSVFERDPPKAARP